MACNLRKSWFPVNLNSINTLLQIHKNIKPEDHLVIGACVGREKTQVITNSLPFDYEMAQRKCTNEDTVYMYRTADNFDKDKLIVGCFEFKSCQSRNMMKTYELFVAEQKELRQTLE